MWHPMVTNRWPDTSVSASALSGAAPSGHRSPVSTGSVATYTVADANDVLGEVGGAVVKRQRHGGIRAGTFGRKLVERLVQAQHPGGVSQPGHLISKPIEWQVHLRGAFAANPVVGQHHQPGGRQHRIGDPGEALQAAPSSTREGLFAASGDQGALPTSSV